MRPIKFRTRDTERKEWVLSIPPEEYMLDEDCWDQPQDPEDAWFICPANPLPTFEGRLIHQQFTGLKDSKGTEIYEGDIVSGICLNAGLSFAVVGFDTWGIFYTKTDEYVKGVEPYHGCCLITQETTEVMGNIFENSDLLKD